MVNDFNDKEKVNLKLSEIELKDTIATSIADRLGVRCEVIQDYSFRLSIDSERVADLAVLIDGDIFAVFEIKTNSTSISHEIDNALNGPPSFLFTMESVRFFIIYQSGSFLVYSRQHSRFEFRGHFSLEELTSFLVESIPPVPSRPSWSIIASRLREFVQGLKFPKLLTDFVLKLGYNDFVFDTNCVAVSLTPRKEERFFKLLLNTQKYDELCRYSTLDSLFTLLKDQTQNMCNPICMNDRGEYRYADKYVFGKAPSINQKAFKEMDSCFILSLLAKNKEDDLTMWRLYGDDAKGACFSYEVNWDLLKKKPYNEHFYISKVSYGNKNGTHRELDLIRAMMHLKVSGWRFQLKQWRIWKHFFKSHHFSVEQEVRLLYLSEPVYEIPSEAKWIKNANSQIATKMHIFNLACFPLKPVMARVGPKCQEAHLLARQFQQIASEGISTGKMRITTSDIKDYR